MPEPTPPAPASGAAPAPAPAPAGFTDLFELSLHALVRPAPSFRAAAAVPAPSFAVSTTLALVNGAAAIAINLVHTAIANPHFLDRYSPRVVAVMAAAALGVHTSLWLTAAVALYAAGRVLGGRGEFDRGLQGASALTVIAPILAMCNPLPYYCWLAPALLLGWLAAGALEGLFAASAAPSRVLGGLLAVVGLAGLSGARMLSDRAPEIESAALLATQAAQVNTALSAMQALPGAAPASGAATMTAPMPSSSLDLLRAPEGASLGDGTAAGPATVGSVAAQGAVAQQQAADIRQSTIAMLDSFMPVLNSTANSSRMTPAQKEQFRQLNGMIQKMRGQLASGKPISDEQMRQQMADIQRVAVSFMMTQAMQPPPAAPKPAPQPHLKPTGNP